MKFRGRTARTLDTQGRIMLPPEFREVLLSRSEGGRLVLTTYDDCVVGFPLPEWIEFEDKLNKIKNPTLRFRNFRRTVISGATEITPDTQGRIRLNQDQLDYAEISNEAVLAGHIDRFELWHPQRLKEIVRQDYADISSELPDDVELIF